MQMNRTKTWLLMVCRILNLFTQIYMNFSVSSYHVINNKIFCQSHICNLNSLKTEQKFTKTCRFIFKSFCSRIKIYHMYSSLWDFGMFYQCWTIRWFSTARRTHNNLSIPHFYQCFFCTFCRFSNLIFYLKIAIWETVFCTNDRLQPTFSMNFMFMMLKDTFYINFNLFLDFCWKLWFVVQSRQYFRILLFTIWKHISNRNIQYHITQPFLPEELEEKQN